MNWFNQTLTLLNELVQLVLQLLTLGQQLLAEAIHIRKLLQIPVNETIQFKGVPNNMPATMTDVQTVAVSGVAATDAAGEAVVVDTTKITWTVGDPTLLTITLDPTSALPTFGFNKGVFTGSLPATSQVSGRTCRSLPDKKARLRSYRRRSSVCGRQG